MSTYSIETAPRLYTRLGGGLYLLIILFGAFAEGFVNDQLMVAGNAGATAQHILDAPGLWRLGTATNLLVLLLAVPLLWIEYQLLRPVSKTLALLGLLLNLVSLAVEAISKVFLLLVLPILQSPGYRQAWGAAGTFQLANLALKSHDITFNIALILFGLTCLVNGYLIFKSGYFPRLVGLLLQVAGASYLVACLAALFAPALADKLIPALLLPPLLGETTLGLWLLLKGVNPQKWQQQLRLSKEA